MSLQYLVDIWNQINAIIIGHPAKKDKFHKHIQKVIREAENYGKYLHSQWQKAKKAGLVSYDENKKNEKEWTWWTVFSKDFNGHCVYFNDDEFLDVYFYIKGKAKPDPLRYLSSMIWGARGQEYEGLELLDYQFTLLAIIHDAQSWQAGGEPIYFNYSLQEMGDNLKDRLCCEVWNHLAKNIDSYIFRDVPRTIETAMRAVRAELDRESESTQTENAEPDGKIKNVEHLEQPGKVGLAAQEGQGSKDKPDANSNSLQVPWDETNLNYMFNKDAIKEAQKVGHDHDIFELKNMNYNNIKKLLRQPGSTIRFMSTKIPRPHGKIHRQDWQSYLRTQIKEANRFEEAVEKETLSRTN
jgi:hypothetical protein